jgi:hypothetical protein
MIETLTDENWAEKVKKSCWLTLVDFEMPPDEVPFRENINGMGFVEKWESIVRVGILDCSRYARTARSLAVEQYPTLALMNGGEPIAVFTGADRMMEMFKLFTVEGLAGLGLVYSSMT